MDRPPILQLLMALPPSSNTTLDGPLARNSTLLLIAHLPTSNTTLDGPPTRHSTRILMAHHIPPSRLFMADTPSSI